jgi:predicted transposase/invertase (TIGR01784 family)
MFSKERYINPFTDFGFKKLFGSEFNKELLIDFLNQVLGGREHIYELSYLNTEAQGRTVSDRKAVFDLHCQNEKGEHFIIELQNVRQQFFRDRSIYYAALPLQELAPKGAGWDYRLKSVYTICILNFAFPDIQERRYRREIQLMDTGTHEIFYDKLTFVYLEMPNFQKKEDELKNHLDKWMYVLKNLSLLQDRPRALQEKIFERLFSAAEIAQLNPSEMKAYDESLKILWDNYSTLETAKREGWAKGREEGLAKGMEEGIEQGVEQGIAQGIAQGVEKGAYLKAVTIAKEMKKEGLPVAQIARFTGLSREDIEGLE